MNIDQAIRRAMKEFPNTNPELISHHLANLPLTELTGAYLDKRLHTVAVSNIGEHILEEVKEECMLIRAMENMTVGSGNAPKLARALLDQHFDINEYLGLQTKFDLTQIITLADLPHITAHSIAAIRTLEEYNGEYLAKYAAICHLVNDAATQFSIEKDIITGKDHMVKPSTLRKLLLEAELISHIPARYRRTAYKLFKKITYENEDDAGRIATYIHKQSLCAEIEKVDVDESMHPLLFETMLLENTNASMLDYSASQLHREVARGPPGMQKSLLGHISKIEKNNAMAHKLTLQKWLETGNIPAFIKQFFSKKKNKTAVIPHFDKKYTQLAVQPALTQDTGAGALKAQNIIRVGQTTTQLVRLNNLISKLYNPGLLSCADRPRIGKLFTGPVYLNTGRTISTDYDFDSFFTNLTKQLYHNLTEDTDLESISDDLKQIFCVPEGIVLLNKRLELPTGHFFEYCNISSHLIRMMNEGKLTEEKHLELQQNLLGATSNEQMLKQIGLAVVANVPEQLDILTTVSIPNYILHHKIGEGASSQVYLADDCRVPEHPKEVAIKLMSFHNVQLSEADTRRGVTKEKLKERFLQEMDHLRSFKHDNVAQIEDKGECTPTSNIASDDPLLYIIQPAYPGKTLAQSIDSVDPICTFQKILEGTGYIHRKKYVHRDIKPENIYMTLDEHIAVIGDLQSCTKEQHLQETEEDLAIRKSLEWAQQAAYDVAISKFTYERIESEYNDLRKRREEERNQTDPGFSEEQSHGLRYAAPQQLETHDIDKRNDVYSLTLTFWEMLTKQKHRLNYGKAYQNRTLDINPEEHNATASAMATAIPEDEIYDHESMKQFFIQNLAYEKERRAEDANELLLQFTHTLTNRPRKKEFTKLYQHAQGDPEMEAFAKEMELLYVQKNRNGGET